MKKLFLLTLSLILLNCSNDDNNSNDNTKTFLENYAGTSWQNTIDIQFYLRFINNLNSPMETYFDFLDCYIYTKFNLAEEVAEIILNEGDVLKIKYGPLDGYEGTYTLTVSGNNLKFEDDYQSTDDVNDAGVDILYFTKTSVDLDALTKCE